jgi:hypothetical protein
MASALHRTDGDGVDDQPRFEASFDREQPSYARQHTHKLSKRRASG